MAAQCLERSRKKTERKELGGKERVKKSEYIIILPNKSGVYLGFFKRCADLLALSASKPW